MEQLALENLLREVRIALDFNKASAPLLLEEDLDTLTLEQIIEQKLLIALRIVHRDAPYYLLGEGLAFRGDVSWDRAEGIGSGRIVLPDDFLRLVCFQMSDWVRPATTPIEEDDVRYSLQGSRFGGIRGTRHKPVVCIKPEAVGLVLEFFSSAEGEGVYVKRARYIPMPRVDGGKVLICPKLRDAVVHYTAYLVALTLGDTEQATLLQTIYKELIQ